MVDVYSCGRRSPAVHQRLLGRAQQQGLTYLYDTLGNALFRDHAEHRSLLTNVMKRSAFFIAHSINDPPVMHDRTEGQDATLGARYFEGAAAGAVLLGSRPQTPVFDDALPWDDAVVPLRYDGTDTVEVLTDLVAQPDRLADVSVRTTSVAPCWTLSRAPPAETAITGGPHAWASTGTMPKSSIPGISSAAQRR